MQVRINPYFGTFYVVIFRHYRNFTKILTRIGKLILLISMHPHLTLNCSKLATETQEKGVKYVQS